MDWGEESKNDDEPFTPILKDSNRPKSLTDEEMSDEFYMANALNRSKSLTVEEMGCGFYMANALNRSISLTVEEMGDEVYMDNALNRPKSLTVEEMGHEFYMDNALNRPKSLTVEEMGHEFYMDNALNRPKSLTVEEMGHEFYMDNALNRPKSLTDEEMGHEFYMDNALNRPKSLTDEEMGDGFYMANTLHRHKSLTDEEMGNEFCMANALNRPKSLTDEEMGDEFCMANALNRSKRLTVEEMGGEFSMANTLNRPKSLTSEEMGDEFSVANTLNRPKSLTNEEIIKELCRAKTLKKSNSLTDEEIVKELRIANGVYYGTQDLSSITSLEMFFNGFPRMVGLCHFQRLCQLTIVSQNIRKIKGLECCPLLRELWVVECQLKEISGIQDCLHLQKLYLYDNQISEIENLELHVNLQVLWLNNNYITDIEGLDTLKELKELNLADNCIENIGHSLDLNKNLQHLNLSGNKISSFKELTLLANLPHLKKLELKGPLSIPNPVCLLFNYATHVLYHLPGLRRLDTYDVSSKQVKQAAESTVMKKMMYYNMRVRTAQKRKLAEIQASLLEQKKTVLEVPVECIRALRYAIKNLECEFSERLHCCKKLRCKMETLRGRLKHWDRKLEEIETWYKYRLSQATSRNAFMVNCLLIELKTLGNVRFEEGCSADAWFMSCHDLVQSRFSAPDYLHHGITGVKVNHIIRIHNRALMHRFDDKLHSLLGFEGFFSVFSQNSKQRLDYLFYRSDPESATEQNGTLYIAEEGFQNPEMFKALGREGAVPLSNSLFVAEQPRIEYAQRHASQSSSKLRKDTVQFRYGQIILAKVFFGRCFPLREGDPVDSSCYPKAHSVYRSVHSCCAASILTQSQWFVFDHELVLPEYIIDFEYITQHPAPSAIPSLGMGRDQISLDEKALNMEPVLKPRPKMLSLNEEILLNVAKADVLSQITILNLNGNSLNKLTEISHLQALRQLTISFNELTRLDDISQMPNLEFVDASHNHLATLEGLRGLGLLKELDLRWNKLTKAREETTVLRKHAPSLQKLDTRHNPWQRPETVRMTILGRLKDLTHLDNVLVAEDKAVAVQRVAASIINQSSLLAHCCTDSDQPCSLSLLSTAQLLCQISPATWDLSREPDPGWSYKITALNLDSQGLSRLSNLDKLINLRWASFNNNDISKLEGLDNCLRLEELSLDDNCITSMDGLPKLSHLSKLSLNGNKLSCLEASVLGQLPYLHLLSVENNCIDSMSGVQRARSLFELYIGNNHICTTRDICYLKPLRKLVILNLYGNPFVERTEHYRIYVVFKLPSLKALDGIAVEVTEKENAKEVFGGRLTPDMLAEKLGNSNYSDITHLSLRSCSIRMVDLAPADLFQNLHTVNFEHNNLKSFSGLIDLPKVKVLKLNYNFIDSILPRQQVQAHLTNRQMLYHKVTSSGYGQQIKGSRDGPAESLEPLMGSLEVLHLSHNRISNMAKLQLSRFKNLKSLFLQSNDISQVEGLEGLLCLRELVLDGNRINAFSHNSFIGQTALVELRLAENRIRELNHLDPMVELHRLFLDKNSLRDVTELDKLEVLPSLTELSLTDNLVSRRSVHRLALVQRLSRLQVLDGVMVTQEERAGAELLNTDTLCPAASMPLLDLSPLGNMSLKMTSLGVPQNFLGHNVPLPSNLDKASHQDTSKHKKQKPSSAARSGLKEMTRYISNGVSEERTQKQTTEAAEQVKSGKCLKQTKFKVLKSPNKSKVKRQFQIQMIGQEGPK